MTTLHGFGKETVYQWHVLTVNKYQMPMPDSDLIERGLVERSKSVLVLPVGQQGTVLVIEEYDLEGRKYSVSRIVKEAAA